VALAARYRETVPPERDYPPCEVSVTAINDAVRRLLADSRPAGSTSITGDSLSVDAVIEGAPEEAGLAARFGSYCHFCVEMLGATEAIPSEPPPIGRVPEPLRPSLEGDALDCFLRDGYDLARRFASSEDGRRLAAARSTNHELPFLMVRIHRDGRIYVRGKIDLVAEFDDHIVVLDFKSDRHLISTDYVGQLQIYAAAAGELFGKPIRTALYHLRSGRLVYVDPDVAPELLVKAIDLALGTVKDELRPVEP
jgi:hypothetical protein